MTRAGWLAERGARRSQRAADGPDAPDLAAKMLAAFIVIASGRVGELIPALEGLPLARIAIIAAVLALLRRDRTRATPRAMAVPIARPALFLLGLACLSLAFSFIKSVTLATITGRVLVVGVFIWLVVKVADSWARIRTLLAAIALACAVLVTHTLLQYSGVRPEAAGGYDPNDLAAVLVMYLPIVATLARLGRGLWRWIWTVLASLATVSVLLTQSRGGLIGLAVVTLVLTIRWWSRGQDPGERPTARAIAVRVPMLALIAVAAFAVIPQSARERLATVLDLESDYNVTSKQEGRLLIWSRNLPLVLARPWGYGAGSFDAVDGLLAGGRYRAAHNMYLQVLVELGVVGLWLLILIFVRGIRAMSPPQAGTGARAPPAAGASADPGPEMRAFGVAVGAGLCGAVVCGFFLSIAYLPALWVLIGMTAVIQYRLNPAPDSVGTSWSARSRN